MIILIVICCFPSLEHKIHIVNVLLAQSRHDQRCVPASHVVLVHQIVQLLAIGFHVLHRKDQRFLLLCHYLWNVVEWKVHLAECFVRLLYRTRSFLVRSSRLHRTPKSLSRYLRLHLIRRGLCIDSIWVRFRVTLRHWFEATIFVYFGNKLDTINQVKSLNKWSKYVAIAYDVAQDCQWPVGLAVHPFVLEV